MSWKCWSVHPISWLSTDFTNKFNSLQFVKWNLPKQRGASNTLKERWTHLLNGCRFLGCSMSNGIGLRQHKSLLSRESNKKQFMWIYGLDNQSFSLFGPTVLWTLQFTLLSELPIPILHCLPLRTQTNKHKWDSINCPRNLFPLHWNRVIKWTRIRMWIAFWLCFCRAGGFWGANIWKRDEWRQTTNFSSISTGSISNIDGAEYTCNKTQVRKVISGVVGAASSVTSIQVANLLRLFRIPQVSQDSRVYVCVCVCVRFSLTSQNSFMRTPRIDHRINGK